MIFDTLKNIKNYKGILANLDKAIDSIIKGEYLTAPAGVTNIDGKEVLFNVQENVIPKNVEDTFFEIHKQYIDIQLIIDGEEKFGYAALEDTTAKNEFSPEKDFQALNGDIELTYTMKAGRFILFFPEEPHMPCLKSGDTEKIKKVVYKIKY